MEMIAAVVGIFCIFSLLMMFRKPISRISNMVTEEIDSAIAEEKIELIRKASSLKEDLEDEFPEGFTTTEEILRMLSKKRSKKKED